MDDEPAMQGRLDELPRTGGSTAGRLGCGAIILICVVGSPFIWSKAKLDYTIRAQVSEGALIALGFRSKLEEYYQQHSAPPNDNEAAGIPVDGAIESDYVSRVEINNGAIVVFFGKFAESEIVDRTIVLTPEFSADRDATWTCRSEDIPDKHLPERCQAK